MELHSLPVGYDPAAEDLKPNAAYHSCAQLETQVVRAMLANFGQDFMGYSRRATTYLSRPSLSRV